MRASLLLAVMCLGSMCAAESPRMVVDLDAGWKFRLHDWQGAEATTFDDRSWESIVVPHTWNAKDGEDGGDNFYRGIGWYRRHLRLGQSGKSLFLRFDGASTVTDVFVNGVHVGEHQGNFGAFCFEITNQAHPGDNVIAVKVDNSHNPNIAPLSGDFTVFGGLYRNVSLIELNPLSITPLDDAGPGVYWKQTHVSQEEAELDITTKIRNVATNQTVNVESRIEDAQGRLVASIQSDADIPMGEQDVIQRLIFPNPHLWNGVIDPYLYRATVTIRSGGNVIDQVQQPLGLRYFKVDPEQGLFLNGTHYSIHGVNKHQDRIDEGWAVSARQLSQDYALIKEMGVTGIRCAHYQHPQAFYNLCDKGGLVVWAELPLVNSLGYSAAFDDNARQQLRELIKQNCNHPSILFWSLFNELGFKNGTKKPEEWALVGELNDLAHQLDPTRLTTAATSLQISHPVNFITDVIAVNRYYGWYGGKPEDWPGELDKLHRAYPKRCIAVSEYGAGASLVHHEVPPKQPKTDGPWHPEEWQSHLHEVAWKAMEKRRWLWGTFMWVMFDFASDGRHEGDTFGRNDKGMVTYDRKTRKDAYYWYKANWTLNPFTYITSRRFDHQKYFPAKSVKVYSNCQLVELVVNGRSAGLKTSADHSFVWDKVELQPGMNRIEAIGDGKYRDECVWVGEHR